MFSTLSDRLDAAFTALRSKGRLTEADIEHTMREIRIALLEADVALPVVRAFVAAARERALGLTRAGALNPAQQVVKIVHEELVAILGGDTRELRLAKQPPTVVMLAGLQGAGKTTLAGKLALHLRRSGHVPLLVAADLQRPSAVEQLRVVAGQAGVAIHAPFPGSGVGDPVEAARSGVDHARRMNHDVVLIDTAGRLGIDEEMMLQAERIRDAVSPDEVLFVLDAMIGQSAVETASAFQDRVGFTGVVLTKLDGDARGGAALSVRHLTGAPVMFASTGEKLSEFDRFHPERMASRILGMGDVLTLIETAERHFDQAQAAEMSEKLVAGEEFNFEDFLSQLQQVRRMGSLGSLLKMLPGTNQIREAIDAVDDRDLDRIQAMISSMTPQERRNPRIIDASRRRRIAAGAGVSVSELSGVIERFFEAQKVMRQMAGFGGLPGMGVPGLPGGKPRRPSSKKKQGKKKRGPGRAGGGPAKPTRSEPPQGVELGPDGLPASIPEALDPLGLYRRSRPGPD